jgi:hypothetical protein
MDGVPIPILGIQRYSLRGRDLAWSHSVRDRDYSTKRQAPGLPAPRANRRRARRAGQVQGAEHPDAVSAGLGPHLQESTSRVG